MSIVMPAFLKQFPFFQLVENEHEAMVAIETIACYATIEEREHLLPQIIRLKHEVRTHHHNLALDVGINNLLAGYLALYGELSDRLIIMLSEDLQRVRGETAHLQQQNCA